MDHVVVKLEQDLAPIDEGKIDEPIWSHDDMKCIRSLLILLVNVLH